MGAPTNSTTTSLKAWLEAAPFPEPKVADKDVRDNAHCSRIKTSGELFETNEVLEADVLEILETATVERRWVIKPFWDHRIV